MRKQYARARIASTRLKGLSNTIRVADVTQRHGDGKKIPKIRWRWPDPKFSLIENRLGKKLRFITLMHNQYSEYRNICHPDPQNVLQNYFDSTPYGPRLGVAASLVPSSPAAAEGRLLDPL